MLFGNEMKMMEQKQRPRREDSKSMTIWLHKEALKKLRDLAEKECIPLSTYTRSVVIKHIREKEKEG